MLIPFPSSGCVDDVVNNGTNYQFPFLYPVTFIHFMNGAGMCVLDYQKNYFCCKI